MALPIVTTTKYFLITLLVIFVLSSAGLFIFPQNIIAESPAGGEIPAEGEKKVSGETSGKILLEDPLGIAGAGEIDKSAIQAQWLGGIIQRVIAPIGAIAFLMFVAGGFYWIFSAGNDEKVKRGRDIMLWTAIGLVVIFAAYAILTFVINALGINPDAAAGR